MRLSDNQTSQADGACSVLRLRLRHQARCGLYDLLRGLFYTGLSIQAFPKQASLPASLRDWWLNQWIQRGDSAAASPIKHVRLTEPAVFYDYYNYDEATVGLYFTYFKEISVEGPIN